MQAIDGHREWKNCVVTLWVMSQFSHLQGVVQTFVIQLLFLGLTPGITQEGKGLAGKPEKSVTKPESGDVSKNGMEQEFHSKYHATDQSVEHATTAIDHPNRLYESLSHPQHDGSKVGP
jgi:hypothetical protein